MRFDDVTADDLFPDVVAALNEDVGQQIGNQWLDASAGDALPEVRGGGDGEAGSERSAPRRRRQTQA